MRGHVRVEKTHLVGFSQGSSWSLWLCPPLRSPICESTEICDRLAHENAPQFYPIVPWNNTIDVREAKPIKLISAELRYDAAK